MTLLAATAAMASAPAMAARYLVTFSGTIGAGYDAAGIFGQPETDLSGRAFTSAYLIDDAAPYLGSAGYYYSGPAVGTAGGFLSVTLTIDGAGVSLDDAVSPSAEGLVMYADDQADPAGGVVDRIYFSVTSRYDGDIINFLTSSPTLIGSTSFTQPIDRVVASGDGSGGTFRFAPGENLVAFGTFDTTRVTAVQLGAVPEPGTWALMLLGLGAGGATARRRVARTTVAA